ncbi:MAG: formamidase, partial [Gaiellales bacterium]|nr:formamidase [Gaiellales bacterium]
MTRHELKLQIRRSLFAAPEAGHNRWHPDLPPALEVDAGDEIVVDCRDGLDGQITPASLDADIGEIDFRRGHPLTGPIAVRGAEPGDVLKVEILSVETDGFGSTAVIPGFGLLGDLFAEPYLVTWGLLDGVATSGRLEGVRIPADPFVGVIGVAPSHERLERFRAREAVIAEAGGDALPPEAGAAVPATEPYASQALRTIPPRETGGNLDVPQARAGATVFLPVDVPGALLSLGDVHFAQGDGEVCGTAIETHGRVTIRVAVLPAAKLGFRPQTPAFEATEPQWKGGRRHFVTTGLPIRPDGSNAEMDTTLAARNALLAMIEWLTAERGLTREAAYVLCSVAVDLRISEIVDVPNPVVS